MKTFLQIGEAWIDINLIIYIRKDKDVCGEITAIQWDTAYHEPDSYTFKDPGYRTFKKIMRHFWQLPTEGME